MKVLDDHGVGSMSNVIDALSFLKKRHLQTPGARSIASISFGGTCSAMGCPGDPLIAKIVELEAVGILFAIAAGNSAISACQNTPAATPGALTAAASDITDTFASFSNFGSCVSIVAPGVNIVSACAYSLTCQSEIAYTKLTGTSMLPMSRGHSLRCGSNSPLQMQHS